MEIDHAFPKTLHAAHSKYKGKNFIECVVCPKCSCLYMITGCNDDQTNPRCCSLFEFPNHPHATRRSACNEVLMKRLKIGGGNTNLSPGKCTCIKVLYMFIEIL